MFTREFLDHAESLFLGPVLPKWTTVHSTSLTVGVPLYFEHDAEDGTGAQGHLINLIDSPGHADLSSEAGFPGVGCWEPGLRIWNIGILWT